jgi:nitroreductase
MNMLFEWDRLNPKEKTSVKGSAEQIRTANKMIMIYTDSYKSKSKNENYKKPDYISLGCAIENMSLQAVNLGLGSCILCDTLYIEDQINEYLKIDNFEQICGFIIGYPVYNYPPKIKKDLKDLLLS